MPKTTVEPGRPQLTIGRTRIAIWIPKPKNTQSEYVILINFPLKQWLHERASALSCRYIALLNKTFEIRYVYYVLILYILCNK